MQINLITSNPGKVTELSRYLAPEIKVNHIRHEYRELRSDSTEEIAEEAAKRLANELKKAVVVEDSGIFINTLKGFPGTCSKYVHVRIGLKGLLKLMEGKKDRSCYYKSVLAYCKPGKEPISFAGEEKGAIAEKERGNFGFGHDPIFIPESSKSTYGEMKDCHDRKKFRRMAADKMKGYFLKNKKL
ncbi:non-canonical purine NTP pyrophosphatase [Candidatus Woesearchaeota archaeon]|nr:non-canonical purine NTP pyrophosphatase [Candidatus Woesearchaeota archaeon]